MNKKPNDTLPKAGRMIRSALEKKGWTQSKLAQLTAMPAPIINDYISGKRAGINPKQVIRIALPLGLDPYDLARAFVEHSIDVEMSKLLDKIKVWSANDKEEEE